MIIVGMALVGVAATLGVSLGFGLGWRSRGRYVRREALARRVALAAEDSNRQAASTASPNRIARSRPLRVLSRKEPV